MNTKKKKPQACTLSLIDEFCITSKCEMLVSTSQENINTPPSYKCKLTKGLEGANGLLSIYQESGMSALLAKAQNMPMQNMQLALTAAIIKLTLCKEGECEPPQKP